jgi:hypothetical protein
MDIKEIKAVIDLMRKNSLTEFEYEKDGTKIRIQRGPDGKPQVFSSSPNLLATPTLVPIPTALPSVPLAPSPTPTPPGSLCPHGGHPLLIYYFLSLPVLLMLPFLSLPVLLLLSYSLQKPC